MPPWWFLFRFLARLRVGAGRALVVLLTVMTACSTSGSDPETALATTTFTDAGPASSTTSTAPLTTTTTTTAPTTTTTTTTTTVVALVVGDFGDGSPQQLAVANALGPLCRFAYGHQVVFRRQTNLSHRTHCRRFALTRARKDRRI